LWRTVADALRASLFVAPELYVQTPYIPDIEQINVGVPYRADAKFAVHVIFALLPSYFVQKQMKFPRPYVRFDQLDGKYAGQALIVLTAYTFMEPESVDCSTTVRGSRKVPEMGKKGGYRLYKTRGRNGPTRGVPVPQREDELGRVEGARGRGRWTFLCC
jgi:hypothetical protein